jgi:hypothetical protein
VNTDPEVDATLWREPGAALSQGSLDLLRTAQGIDGTAELGQQTIASGLDDSAFMTGYAGIDYLRPDRPEPLKRSLLVGADKPRVARHIRGENGGKTAGRGHFRQNVKWLLIKIST